MSQDFCALEEAPATTLAMIESEASASASAKDIAFGSLAGMLGKFIEYPFDTVKVRLQSQAEDYPLRYRGPLDCLVQGLRHDGVRGMYRGISSPLVGAAAENSLLFFSYNLAQAFTRRTLYPDFGSKDPLPIHALITCGAASGSFASFVLTPIELIKCKMQVQSIFTSPHLPTNSPGIKLPSTPPGPLALIGDVYRTYGIRGFWHGQMGTFLRETGGSAAWFGAYEHVSLTLRHWRDTDSLPAGDMMLAGAAAGVSYNFVLFPADSVKSRMQTEAISADEKTKGFWAVGRGMYKAGGLKSLYRGCGITCARSAPSSAIIFLCYEKLKAWSR